MELNKKTKTVAATKPIYVCVVRQMRGNGETMTQGFKEFDKAVNAKIAEGYVPHGSLVVDHCSASSMDVIQPMLLAVADNDVSTNTK